MIIEKDMLKGFVRQVRTVIETERELRRRSGAELPSDLLVLEVLIKKSDTWK